MIRMLKGLQDVVLFQSTYLQVRLLLTILRHVRNIVLFFVVGWQDVLHSFIFFSLKNISSIRCNCTQYKYNNMKSVHNSSEKKAAFHQIATSISCKKKNQGEHKKSRLLPVPLLAPGVLPLKNGNTIKCHGKVVLTFNQQQYYEEISRN